jgi:uridine kinase
MIVTLESNVRDAVSVIADRVHTLAKHRCFVLAITGIDGAGKTTLARDVAAGLDARGLNAQTVRVDDWHTAPEVRFSNHDPGRHFYRNAYRFEELFGLLVEPLRVDRTLTLSVTLRRLPLNDTFENTYHFVDTDVLILEGIFLLKTEWRNRYDFSIWVDSSFETALQCAIVRNQEGLDAGQLIADYERIYFAAQRIHLAADAPSIHADLVISTGS